MEVTGIILKKTGENGGTSVKTGMPWRNAEFLMEIPGEYKRHINFKVRDGQYDMIARFEAMVGKMVKVSFNIEAHEVNGRWYNEIRAWGIMEYVAGQVTGGSVAGGGVAVEAVAADSAPGGGAQPQQADPAQQPASSFEELERKDASTPPDYNPLAMDQLPF